MTGQADHPNRTLVRGQNVIPPDPVPGATLSDRPADQLLSPPRRLVGGKNG